jgi:hypothetical protein
VRLRGASHGSWRVRCKRSRPSNRRQGLRSSRDPTLNGWKVRIFVDGIPANGFTYSVDSEVYQDAAIDGVPEDLVAGLMETVERDFRRGLAQELVAAERLPTTISRRKR